MGDPSNAAATDGLKNALMKGSVSDILHDFGQIVSKTDLNKSVNFKTEILDGLPASGQDLITGSLTEEAFVNSIIDSINDKKPNPGYNFDFVPNTEFYSTIAGTDPFPPDFTFAKKKYTEHYQIIQKVIDAKFAQINEEYPPPPSDKDPLKTFNIKTITGFDYTVTQSVIKKKKIVEKNNKNEKYEYYEPLTILKQLGIETNSAFVVDFAAVSLPDFLTQSDTNQPANEIKLYFISNPETENDPAGKTGVTTPAYKNISNKDFKNGVEIFSLQQTSTPSQVTNYTWTDSNNLSHNRFFTKYNFALSDLKEIKDKKLIKFQTDLTISYTDPISNKLYKEVIINSGNHGDITNVISSIISKIKDLFAPKRKTDNEVFYMNSKFQHKRSGDWLQVLSCLNLKENNFKSPNFKYPISPNNTYNNQPFPLQGEEPISDVYFVTHDRIPFAVALLLGVNVVYTHNATGAYYVFKSTPALSPEEKLAKYKQEVNKIIKSELYQLLKENDSSNKGLIDNVKNYNLIIEQKTYDFNLNIDTLLEKIASIKKIDLPLRDSNINDNIKKLFEELYRYSKFLAENKQTTIY
jgi:hypothetical protein